VSVEAADKSQRAHKILRRYQPGVAELVGLVSGEHLACLAESLARYQTWVLLPRGK
jgi:hypothetical protein